MSSRNSRADLLSLSLTLFKPSTLTLLIYGQSEQTDEQSGESEMLASLSRAPLIPQPAAIICLFQTSTKNTPSNSKNEAYRLPPYFLGPPQWLLQVS